MGREDFAEGEIRAGRYFSDGRGTYSRLRGWESVIFQHEMLEARLAIGCGQSNFRQAISVSSDSFDEWSQVGRVTTTKVSGREG